MSDGKPKNPPPIAGIPADEITEAMKSFETVKLRVTRRNDKGEIGTVIQGVVMPIKELFDIEEKLMTNYGGGNYTVECLNPNGHMPYMIAPRFTVRIEGHPRPTPGSAPLPPLAPPAQGPGSGTPWNQPAPPQSFGPTVPQFGPMPASAWAQGLNPHDANAYIQQGNAMYGYGQFFKPAKEQNMNPVYDNVVATMRGDLEKARGEAERARGETKVAQDRLVEVQMRYKDEKDHLLRDQEKKVEEMRRDHEKKIEEMRRASEETKREFERKLDQLDRGFDRERAEMRERIMRAEFAATAAAAAPKGNAMNELIIGIVPVMTMMIKSSADRDAAERSMQLEMMKLQHAPKKGDSEFQEMAKILLPLAIPLLTKWLDGRSPDSVAALLEATQNSQMQGIGMVMQIIEQMTPEEKPMWAQMLQEFLGNMRGVGEQMFNKMVGDGAPAPRGLPAPQVVNNAPQHARPAQRAPQQEVSAPAPSNGNGTTNDTTDPVVLEVVQKIMPNVPVEFHTAEWVGVLVALRKAVPAEGVAAILGGHLAMLTRNNLLPPQLMQLVEDPVDTLDALLRPMVDFNILNGEYASQVIYHTLIHLNELGVIEWSPPEEMVDDEDGDEGESSETLSDAMEDADVEHEELEPAEA